MDDTNWQTEQLELLEVCIKRLKEIAAEMPELKDFVLHDLEKPIGGKIPIAVGARGYITDDNHPQNARKALLKLKRWSEQGKGIRATLIEAPDPLEDFEHRFEQAYAQFASIEDLAHALNASTPDREKHIAVETGRGRD